jgi:hypothetical protein|tara:strand:- start:1598 stop:1762 length:165 start_codon:yes stop_codon:yes gene_type:complete
VAHAPELSYQSIVSETISAIHASGPGRYLDNFQVYVVPLTADSFYEGELIGQNN